MEGACQKKLRHCSTSIASSDNAGSGKKRSSGGGDVGGDGSETSGLKGADNDGSNPASSTSSRFAGSTPPRNSACSTTGGSLGASSTQSSSSDDASKSVTMIPIARTHTSHVSRTIKNVAFAHALSFSGSYHDDERILMSSIASVDSGKMGAIINVGEGSRFVGDEIC